MSLRRYQEKRHGGTNEPIGVDAPASASATYRGVFVVHLHEASKTHFDLRLEIGGVLVSFALPKGPTRDADARHLAIRTEDHPLSYLDFEGVIPAGNYGAGAMIAWDLGAVRYLDDSAEAGLRDGKLHFALEGRKLMGRFGLVRLKPRSRPSESAPRRPQGMEWLFLKKRDGLESTEDLIASAPRSVLSGLAASELESARERAKSLVPRALERGGVPGPVIGSKVRPMLCKSGPLREARRWFELKLDGVRVLASKEDGQVTMTYRSGRRADASFPEVRRALELLPIDRAVFDGEIVAFDAAGRPNFERLLQRVSRDPKGAVEVGVASVPVVFMVFDLLGLGDVNLMNAPLRERKAILGELIQGAGIVRVLDHLESGGERLFQFCVENRLEGVIAKDPESRYVMGPTRGNGWIKTKCEREASFVVVGFTSGEGQRARLGALDLASSSGSGFRIAGKVGSGLTDAVIDELLPVLSALSVSDKTAEGVYDAAPRGRTHVTPAVVVRVRFLEWSGEGHLRFPVFLRVDRTTSPTDCRELPLTLKGTRGPEPDDEGPRDDEPEEGQDDRERLVWAAAEGPDEAPGAKDLGAQGPKLAEPSPPTFEVRTTHREKVFWPDGTTKGDLIDYYGRMAETLLPYLADRPVMLVRYPDGVDGKSFYQWNVPHGLPSWVRSVKLGRHAFGDDSSDLEGPSEPSGPSDPDGPINSSGSTKHVFLLDRRESLLFIANLACIPIHVLGSRVTTPNASDFLTVDFDLGGGTFQAAVTLAKALRTLCEEVGLTPFLKTSGQTGLHVLVPLGRGVAPSTARTFAEFLGRLLVASHGDLGTMIRTPSKRGNKVYVDTGQTGPSRTIVAPYSVRASTEPRVSTPLFWDELEPSLRPADFTIRSVPKRVADVGDPMRALLTVAPNLERVVAELGRRVQG